MKKYFKLLIVALAGMTMLASCADVPAPFALPAQSGGSEGETPAAIAVTCAEAVAIVNALSDGATTSETYTITGYITSVIGSVSRDQQSFWIADTKGGGNVFQAFWANLPSGVSQFNVGTKVTLTGKLMKYVKNDVVTPEMKNATVVILEDDNGGNTGGDVTATNVTCAEAVALVNALSDGGTSAETYTITGYITSVISAVSRDQQSFWIADTKDGGNVFQAYWANLPAGVTQFVAGSKVTITGKLMKYVKDDVVTPEIKNATVVVLEAGDGGNTGGDNTGGGGEEVTELTNLSFETWTSGTVAEGWSSAASSATVSQATDARTGSYSACMAAAGTINKRLASQAIKLAAGNYTFSFYAKAGTTQPCQARAGIAVYDATGALTSSSYKYSGYVDLNNTGWTRVEYTFTLDAESTISVIALNPKETAGKHTSQDILVDDAELVKK